MIAVAMTLIAGAAMLYGFRATTRSAGPPPNAVPVVLLMDTTAPNGVYDPITRKNSGSNADDLSDGLRDMPIALHKELVGSTWDREDQIAKQVPDLIVMHRSAFVHALVRDFELASAASGVSGDSARVSIQEENDLYKVLNPVGRDKFDAFLGYMGKTSPRTRFLIYSREWEPERHNWEHSVEKRFPELSGRVFTISISIKDGTASFRDLKTIAQVRQAVGPILKLHSPSAAP